MTAKPYTIISALLFFIAVFSCNEQVELPVDQGYDYFPLQGGKYWVYEAEEIHVIGSTPDTSRYFLMEVIEDSIVNGLQTTYLVNRYTRTDSASSWMRDSVWTARITDKQAIVTENNIPFVKLTFPVVVGKSWNGNALNTLSENEYYYESIGSFTSGNMDFPGDSVMQVIIADVPPNLVEQDERSEIYVQDVGLVQKNYISASFCQPGSGCEEVGIIDEGRILHQVLIAYGEE